MGTQGQSRNVVFLSGKRTGFGTFGGSLKGLSATIMATTPLRTTTLSSKHSDCIIEKTRYIRQQLLDAHARRTITSVIFSRICFRRFFLLS